MQTEDGLNFRSDNVATVCPEIMQALQESNVGASSPYGDDAISRRLDEAFSALFEKHVKVYPVSTGTAANSLSLAACTRPWGGVYCYEDAHINIAECGATEAFSGGAKLLPLTGPGHRIAPDALGQALRRSTEAARRGQRNRVQPDVVSITQANERGTVYDLDELAQIAEHAQEHGIRVHMDGARFANALVHLGCTPADMTWRRGVDILSFGATKNGAMNTEAIVVFDPVLVEPLWYRLRRAGQTWSKMRFAAVQLLAYVRDGLFLHLAARSNAHAARLAGELATLSGVTLLSPVQANLVFVRMPPAMIEALSRASVLFERPAADTVRLATRFDNRESEIDRLLTICRSAA